MQLLLCRSSANDRRAWARCEDRRESAGEFAASGNYEIKYVPYNWGLNDQGPHGRNYSRAQLLLDKLFK